MCAVVVSMGLATNPRWGIVFVFVFVCFFSKLWSGADENVAGAPVAWGMASVNPTVVLPRRAPREMA